MCFLGDFTPPHIFGLRILCRRLRRAEGRDGGSAGGAALLQLCSNCISQEVLHPHPLRDELLAACASLPPARSALGVGIVNPTPAAVSQQLPLLPPAGQESLNPFLYTGTAQFTHTQSPQMLCLSSVMILISNAWFNVS